MAPSISAIWSSTCRPISGSGSRKCAATSASMSAPTTPTARPLCYSARQEGISPEELIARSHQRHIATSRLRASRFDNYYTTHSPENRAFCEQINARMVEAIAVRQRGCRSIYCEHDKCSCRTASSRGTCPNCGRGAVRRLLRPLRRPPTAQRARRRPCTLCGKTPVIRESDHLFVELEHLPRISARLAAGHTARDVANKLIEWFDEPLKPWEYRATNPTSASRSPGHPGKYFYVWVDAPIGYMASHQKLVRPERASRSTTSGTMPKPKSTTSSARTSSASTASSGRPCSKRAGFLGPDQVFVHGFLTVNGEKMSKSKGTFINARTYLDFLHPCTCASTTPASSTPRPTTWTST
jgi:methionyl-tRNA synthetase